MLVCNDVWFGYDTTPVIKGLDFQMAEGEFVFMIGKSGSGKSTILKMLYMDIQPKQGYISFGGVTSPGAGKSEIVKLRRMLGVVFQDYKLLQERTVYENLAFVLEVTGTKKKDIRARINDALMEVGLHDRKKSYPSELSGGEQQRVAIARAIINNPLLIIADEPTGNLDPVTSSEILSIFTQINKKGTAVFFATHNYDMIKKNTARIVSVENGKLNEMVLKQKP